MSGWNKIKLKDVTTKIGSGATPRGGKNSYHSSGIPLIRSLNVYDLFFEYKNLAFINNEQAKKLNNVEVKKGDVLINITGASVCRTTSAPDNLIPARVNQHVSIIRADNKELFGCFLKYLLVSSKYKGLLLNIAGTGATREALTKEDLENFEIKVPAYSLQKKIASILSAYDDLIEVNNRRIKILEEMAQLIYKEWFVNFKFPGHDKVKIKNVIPEGWELNLLKDFVDFERGVEPGSKNYNEKRKKGTIPFLRVGDLGSRNSKIYIEEEFAKGKKLTKNDIAISMDGTVGIVKIGLEGTYSTGIRKINIKDERLSRSFVYFLLLSDDIQNIIKAHAQGATILHASKSIDYMKLLLPPDDLLKKFNEIVEPILELRLNLEDINCNLIRTRDLLLPKLMSGETELKE